MATEVQILEGPTIPAGEAISDAIDCSAGRVIRITMPAGWDSADLTFQISTDSQFFNDLWRPDGTEYMMRTAAGRALIVNQEELLPGLFLKFRSGHSDQPRPQREERVFAIALLVETA